MTQDVPTNQKAERLDSGYLASAFNWCARRTHAVVLAMVLVTCAGFAGNVHWFFDAMNHTRWHLVGIGGVIFVILALHRRGPWMALALGVVACNLLVVAPWDWYSTHGATQATGPEVKVLFWNINAGSRNTDQMTRLIRQAAPDVVALLEVHHDHIGSLAWLRKDYPAYRERPRSGAFGLAVYSRLPVQWDEQQRDPPEIRGVVNGGESATGNVAAFDLWAVHVFPPMNSTNRSDRNRQFERIAEDRVAQRSTGRPLIMGGDLNITPWCHEFRKLVADAGLLDTRAGQGYQATWPTGLGRLGIPIDHVLVSQQWEVLGRRVLEGHGVSDHSAVLVTLRQSDNR
ncbi:MAG: endonuclease/exonuclease/phosphatase family protein [Planctomycetota bacterium]